ncbi:hypothetical protein QM480_22270 [Flectobacillus sp. DC10W]|uniref:Uncharacterized protein n=1 Tax=Flectobacillus longus TaxID=2984207 RepID=A0ABT6YU09_9BACT|nr:hypothetical protein [Flectobacillus longus]MDI9867083.1 hypothetical protein [Flectobacillus longus]
MNVNYLCVIAAYYKIRKGFGKGGVNVEPEAWGNHDTNDQQIAHKAYIVRLSII